MSEPLPTSQVIRVLLSMSTRRWFNRMSALGRVFRRRKTDAQRTATPGKHRPRRITALLITSIYVFLGISVSSGIVRNVAGSVTDAHGDRVVVDRWTYGRIIRTERYIDRGERRALRRGGDPSVARQRERTELVRFLVEDTLEHDIPADGDPLSALAPDQRPRVEHILEVFDARGAEGFVTHQPMAWLGDYTWAADSAQFRTVAALVLCLSFVCLLLMSLGNANTDLGHVDWTLQWLFTFPVRARSLFLAKTIELALLNTMSWIAHASLLFTVMWSLGYGGWAIPIALAATLYINVLLAVARLILETWLRKRLSLRGLKNIQAACTATGVATMLMLYVLSYVRLPFELSALAVAPEAVGWLPWSVPAMLVAGGATTLVATAMMVMGAPVVIAGGVRLAEHIVRDGLIVAAGGYRGQRGAGPMSSKQPRAWFRGIVGRELVLLLRDRNLLVQTLIVPAIIIGFQLAINPRMLSAAAVNSRHASALAFGIGALVLMGGAFMALSNEGKALWLLFTFPQRIDQILRRKAVVWGSIAALYTLGVIVVVAILAGGLDLDAAIGAVTALAGIAIYAALAAGMGILGTDPLAEEVQRKVRPTVLWTYMMLVGLFVYGFYAPHWTKLVLVTVCGLLAVAIWQIVKDRAPLLLDPTHRAAPRIALSDGLIAVLAFVVLQGVVTMAGARAGAPTLHAVVAAFVIAGAVVALTSLYVFWRRQVPEILATVGLRAPTGAKATIASVLHGIALGAGAGAFGLLYQRFVLERFMLETGRSALPSLLVVLTIVAAPLFEEFIFRGLVFRGLRRSTNLAFAIIASAAIFAIVHPPASFVPVFGLGVATALAFERSGRLIAPICAHAVYNAILVLALSL